MSPHSIYGTANEMLCRKMMRKNEEKSARSTIKSGIAQHFIDFEKHVQYIGNSASAQISISA